jgi:hypothetical protein
MSVAKNYPNLKVVGNTDNLAISPGELLRPTLFNIIITLVSLLLRSARFASLLLNIKDWF